MTKPTEANVDFIKNAIGGDLVWEFDGNGNNYRDGVYVGRGSWRLIEIGDMNRASFILNGEKFDRETGIARPKSGWTSMRRLFGQKEYEGRIFKDNHQYKLLQHIERNVTDGDVLKKIADLVGYKYE